MKPNIIGDIHGRTNWKELVRDGCTNVFVGDFFSPYINMPFEEQLSNFMDIVNYKLKHPETVLLVGNHDEDHWHAKRHCSRHDSKHESIIKEVFEENKDLFQVACAIDNVLITHAGVSVVWYCKYKYGITDNRVVELNGDDINEAYESLKKKFPPYANFPEATAYKFTKDNRYYIWRNGEFVKIDDTPQEIADFINGLWNAGKYSAFDFFHNSDFNDYCGESQQHGPMWNRPATLVECNIFSGTSNIQVAGHTQFGCIATYINNAIRKLEGSIQMSNIDNDSPMVYVDCLGYSTESLLIDNRTLLVNK